MSGILAVEEIHLPLAFLCHTRHNGQRKDLVRRNTKLFREICLHDRAEHLLRGFRRGKTSSPCTGTGLHKRTQPGQQDVNIGLSFSSPLVNRFINSVLSSMIVRSAENTVSKT